MNILEFDIDPICQNPLLIKPGIGFYPSNNYQIFSQNRKKTSILYIKLRKMLAVK